MNAVAFALAASVTVVTAGAQAAEVFPARPITMVVPFSAGGPTDVLARIMAERMTKAFGQSVIVENLTGAAGTIGVGRVARAAPDGYTLVLGNLSTHVVNGAVYSLAYDVFKDFQPVALVASNPQLIVARQALAPDTLADFIAWLKRTGAAATQGTAGVGSPAHLSGVFLQSHTGASFRFVPYRGAAPIMQDLIAGQIDFTIAQTANALPPARAGSIKVFAVTSESRLAAAPDIPTAAEAGLPGFHVAVWHGLWAPKGTPDAIIERLDHAVAEALDDPTVRQRFAQLGIEVPPRDLQTPPGLRAYHRAEIDKWWPVVRAANMKPE
jgi:tripartite-type tricarboxylate transporter receptor subunit TctC